jgi:hypothetical protein
MTRDAIKTLLAGFVLFSCYAVADDPTNSTPSKDKQMQECMAKQRASNSHLTQAAMETVCKNEIDGKGTKDGNDLATAPKQPTH